MELAIELSPPESKHYRSWSDRLDSVSRYDDPDEIHSACERARAAGATAVLAVLDRRAERALQDLQSWREMAVWAVVPNMNAFIRDLTDRGLAGAAIARFLRLTPAAMTATAWKATRELRRLARSDFSAGALWLAEMELAAARGLRIERVFLHPQLTEIALAGGVRELFVEFAHRIRRSGREPGLVTHNPVRAADVLGPTLDEFAAVVSPCNPKGYKMVPDRAACESVFRARPEKFWASEIGAGASVPMATSLAYVASVGLRGAVLDFRELAAPPPRDAAGGRGRPRPRSG
jgi:hypothetical protein